MKAIHAIMHILHIAPTGRFAKYIHTASRLLQSFYLGALLHEGLATLHHIDFVVVLEILALSFGLIHSGHPHANTGEVAHHG
jgi:hypothetical protein